MDESPEFLNAIHYAASRAAKSGGVVEILGIIGPEEFQHWLGVADAMRAEAKQRIEARFKEFSDWMIEKEGIEPELVIREGERANEVIEQIKADKEVGVLGEDVKRLTERFSSIGSKQEKVTEEFRQLNISVNKVINRSEKIMNLDLNELEKIEKKK